MNKAIFLDRDGTINEPVLDHLRHIHRPPWNVNEIKLIPNVIRCFKKLNRAGYMLFIVTNQPDQQKGRVTIQELESVRNKIYDLLTDAGIVIKEDYYCYHHPTITPCECRKPSPYFILKATKQYDIDLSKSWMIGDRETDIECGQNAGTKTIRIDRLNDNTKALHTVKNISEATEIILTSGD